mmetsp:Transcript_30212/g.49915  ORF Transcript_30212/g.49915 Transcript_30212/m.49915 type:complete len:614 (+) Transcript_30212:124-1965(+)|eukprot:CAMPEP_0119003420 /NCGR_PEP_ID=MMETSP1176-20130426/548_1 /TAXON_ID=265551 /ORGANISM="Synedropsis recta cf, Strain CCMP1620" /LENGTH=613 /DNA_ID=CAMNT_0006955021 /DNA_START=299 /DNA_END=2140 /DNA_ORIENTATION=-
MSAEKNAEIWSTRLQKELLALTTENATSTETKEVAGILPPFIQVKTHEMDINEGICKVYFVVTVPSPSTTEASTEESAQDIVVVMDASLARLSDGSLDATAAAYPFAKPRVMLASGAERFPEGSTISDNDQIDIDCDWTPSLHLTDAVLNIGLKIKESVLQGEPFFPAKDDAPNPDGVVDDLVQSARRFTSFLGKSAKTLVETTNQTTKTKLAQRRKQKAATKKNKATTTTDISIGDEIHLLEAPWVDCHGLYSCKAIRRPAFCEDAIFLAQTKLESAKAAQQKQQLQSASTGFAGAGAMFRSFTQSAKSVLEESFLMITETHIIELRSSKLNLSTGTVTFAISIELMAKLKFRRQESISLFFKPAPDDPLIFMCPDSAAAVHQIQSVLKSHGVKGKHTNAATQKAIHDALQIVQEIQAKERALEYQPSAERVNEIMDLYRQAAERFEVAGDIRHEEVVVHMRKFLAQPLTASILDGSYQPDEKKEAAVPTTDDEAKNKPDGPVPEGEVLERTKEQLDADDDSNDGGDDADDAFVKTIDNVLAEAQQDMDEFNNGLEDGEAAVAPDAAADAVVPDSTAKDDADDDDMFGDAGLDDLDAMLADADAELADLMAS